MSVSSPQQKYTLGASRRAAGAFIVIIAVFLAGLWAGIHQTQTHAQTATSSGGVTSVTLDLSGNTPPSNVDLTPLWRAWNLLDQNFVEVHASSSIPTDTQKVYGAIQGLVASYGDPYTTFFPPSDAQVFDQNISGSFGGVGMEIGTRNGALVVI